MNSIKIFLLIGAIGIFSQCSDFLDVQPQGVLNEVTLANEKGVKELLVSAYAELSGHGRWWSVAPSNWMYGDIPSDDAYVGQYNSDPSNLMNKLEDYSLTAVQGSSSIGPQDKWQSIFKGISRCNAVIRTVKKVEGLSEEDVRALEAEARFLRAHYHFEGKKIFNKFPFIDETVTDFRVSNKEDIWPLIEADLQFAYENLPEVQEEIARVTRWSAAALLAKAHLFQNDYAAAKPLLDDIIANSGRSLTPKFYDNFNEVNRVTSEDLFIVNFSVNDPERSTWDYQYEGNIGEYDFMGWDAGGPSWGGTLYKGSYNLANAFRTDPNTGLPLFDSYNTNGLPLDDTAWDFVPYQGTLDPRIDHTLGRAGLPYLDWGIHGGWAWRGWVSDFGIYNSKKRWYRKENTNEYNREDHMWWLMGLNANNYSFIRYADVLLWAAECEVETGSLDKAKEYVNEVRRRAANPAGMVKIYKKHLHSEGYYQDSTVNAANYLIKEYPSFPDKEYARQAVRWERRLELAMEGHRFFDLVRWGIAAETINAYLAVEGTRVNHLAGVHFVEGKNEYQPIDSKETGFLSWSRILGFNSGIGITNAADEAIC